MEDLGVIKNGWVNIKFDGIDKVFRMKLKDVREETDTIVQENYKDYDKEYKITNTIMILEEFKDVECRRV